MREEINRKSKKDNRNLNYLPRISFYQTWSLRKHTDFREPFRKMALKLVNQDLFTNYASETTIWIFFKCKYNYFANISSTLLFSLIHDRLDVLQRLDLLNIYQPKIIDSCKFCLIVKEYKPLVLKSNDLSFQHFD